jgi:hypothetical protein
MSNWVVSRLEGRHKRNAQPPAKPVGAASMVNSLRSSITFLDCNSVSVDNRTTSVPEDIARLRESRPFQVRVWDPEYAGSPNRLDQQFHTSGRMT